MYKVYGKDGESYPCLSDHLTVEDAEAAFQAGGRIEKNSDGIWTIVKDDSVTQ